MKKKKIVKFTDLVVWQESYGLSLLMYESTENFPGKEMFGLISQMRRASISIAANIAEGFGRWSYKDKAHFYQQAHGSLTELKSHIYIAFGLKYLTHMQMSVLLEKSDKVHMVLIGLMKSTRIVVEKQK